ncbi:Beta-glucan synthesis-associated protein (SKN1) [Fragilaria crotonensis]|nr:Beta-glucan synthesis-associated protein (SKN1) [Fragilaria crotonensis]
MSLLATTLALLHISSSRASWVDPDTPKKFYSTRALVETDTREYELVFSDEFNVQGRTFNDGNDPRWTALNKNDYTNDALHYYSHDNAITRDGVLSITTEQKQNLYKAFNEKTKKFYVDSKYIQSAMLQGWNKFCITGGIVEFSAKLPGDPSTGGLWPALWLLGNLARASDQHVYRVEWEPPEEDGSGGYIKWFIDGDLTYGVSGKSLEITGSEIPSEPMYLLMNTAVSSNWGFPKPCPDGCKCTCYHCDDPDCFCALPQGYCSNFPATFEIDHVRVYQAVNDSKQVLGCSTRKRPTDLFIKGHARRYMAEGDTMPLQPVRRGGGTCSDDNDCGGPNKGTCTEKKHCECLEEFTGPSCLAHAGFYDHEDVEVLPPFHFDLMYVPPGLVIIVVGLIGSFLLSLVGFRYRKKEELSYQRIPNGEPGGGLARGGYPITQSYQNSAVVPDYTVPMEKKVVAYIVIDGRLVDQT